MRWPLPTIAEVAKELRTINANVECKPRERCDVRLQVYANSAWATRYWVIRSGPSEYDPDPHLGYWGYSSIPGVVNGVVKRFSARCVARDLLKQVRDAHRDRR